MFFKYLQTCLTSGFIWISTSVHAISGNSAQHPLSDEFQLYTPQKSERFSENWRWQFIEQPSGHPIRCLEDAGDGSIWVGGEERMWKFDGIHWHEFNEFPEGVPIGWIKDILVTQKQEVYMRSQYGLFLLNENRWERLVTLEEEDNTAVPLMVEAADGSVWSVSPDGVVQIKHDQVIIIGGFSRNNTNVWIDKNKNLWTTLEGDNFVIQIPLHASRPTSIENWTYHPINLRKPLQTPIFFESSDGKIWVADGDPQNPVFIIDPDTSAVQEIDLLEFGSNNMIHSITETNDGTIWISSLDKINTYQNGRCIVYSSFDRNVPQYYTYVTATQDGIIWIWSNVSLLYRFDYSHNNWLVYEALNYQCSQDGVDWFISKKGTVVAHHLRSESWVVHKNTIDLPVRILALKNKKILVTGSHENQACTAILTEDGWLRQAHPEFARGFSRHSVFETRDGRILLGAEFNENLTPSCKGGLLIYTPDSSKFGYKSTILDDPQIPFRLVTIAEDANGMIWFGENRLMSYDPENRLLEKHLEHVNSTAFRVSADSKGNIWVSTWGNGVYQKTDNGWTRYGVENGLSSEFVSALIPLDNGLCWAGTLKGICLFDGRGSFTKALGDNFRSNLGPSSIRAQRDNYLWINQVSTRWYTEPGIPPESETTENSVYRSIRYRMDADPPDTILTQTVDKVAARETAHFTWSGTDAWGNTPSDDLQFSYRFDDEPWSDFSETTHISRVDDHPGQHTLEVRARDQSLNVDPTPVSISFLITAPMWLQPWFITTISILVIMIIGLVILLIHSKLRHVIELEQVKLHFFTNISHQLKTPLTVILGPLDTLISKTKDPESLFQLQLARKNTQHMLHLVEQLLDFRRIQAGKTDLEMYEFNLVQFVHDTAREIEPLAQQKDITFNIQTPNDKKICRFDPPKVRSIIENLLSNAIKYTDDHGTVAIQLEIIPGASPQSILAKIVIEDNGIGIPKSDVTKVFEPYYRITRKDQNHSTGNGIGLSYTKELVALFNGSIKIQSPLNPDSPDRKGTRITVFLDLETSPHHDDHEEEDLSSDSPETNNISSLLIVEDNDDIRAFLKSQFVEDYHILEARDGESGFELAKKESPQLILADLMMPRMGGLEMTRLLKKETLTSHIPVIILTAKKSDYDQIELLKTGVDDYLTKPVRIEILKTKIQNIFDRIKERQTTFSQKISIEPKEIVVGSADETFLKKALDLMESKMEDFEFDVPEFATSMNMSRTNLYLKMKAITGETPSGFIKMIRLKRAAQLLKTGNYNVNEVVEKVGFLDPSYFSSCFKKQFHCSPKQYQTKEGPPKKSSSQLEAMDM